MDLVPFTSPPGGFHSQETAPAASNHMTQLLQVLEKPQESFPHCLREASLRLAVVSHVLIPKASTVARGLDWTSCCTPELRASSPAAGTPRRGWKNVSWLNPRPKRRTLRALTVGLRSTCCRILLPLTRPLLCGFFFFLFFSFFLYS